MYKVLMTLICFCLFGLCRGLSSYNDSSDFAMDTIDPLLEIVCPSGGEEWFAGTEHSIQWIAQDHNFLETPISLFYSLDNGMQYLLIQEDATNNGFYDWLVPMVQTENARIRIRAVDSFGNIGEISSLHPFMIYYLPPAPPQNLVVDTGGGQHAVLSWDPVTSTIPPYNQPFTPDGYIVLYNESPYEDEHFFYFLGRSFANSFTHQDVVEFRDQMFYMVLAYKNYSRGAADTLDAIVLNGNKQGLLWRDIEALIKQGGQK